MKYPEKDSNYQFCKHGFIPPFHTANGDPGICAECFQEGLDKVSPPSRLSTREALLEARKAVKEALDRVDSLIKIIEE